MRRSRRMGLAGLALALGLGGAGCAPVAFAGPVGVGVSGARSLTLGSCGTMDGADRLQLSTASRFSLVRSAIHSMQMKARAAPLEMAQPRVLPLYACR